MEVLGAILLVELFVGVLVLFFGLTRGIEGGVLAGESAFTIAPLRIVEPVQIPHLQRTCRCKNTGCTV